MRGLGGTGLRVMCLPHWEMLTEETRSTVFLHGDAGMELEHTAVFETSVMMHYHPRLGRCDRIPDNPAVEALLNDLWPPRRERVPKSRALVSTVGAAADKARMTAKRYLGDTVPAVRRELVE